MSNDRASQGEIDRLVVPLDGSELEARDGGTLVCMSTHGRGGLAQAVLGSVATRVVHESHCPVLVTPVRYEGLVGR